MRKPRPEDYDPNFKKSPKPDEIDLEGIVPLKARGGKITTVTKEVYSTAKVKSLKVAKDEQPQSRRDTIPPRNHDTVVSRNHDTIIEQVRKAVKEFGKEAATHRFTLDEKGKLSEIIFACKRKKIRTSENEITRIAINYIMADYDVRDKDSILSKVLQALNE